MHVASDKLAPPSLTMFLPPICQSFRQSLFDDAQLHCQFSQIFLLAYLQIFLTGLSAFQAGIPNHPFRHRICQPTCNQPFPVSWLPARPATQPREPTCMLLRPPSRPHPTSLMRSRLRTSLPPSQTNNSFDAIRPPVQRKRCWTVSRLPTRPRLATHNIEHSGRH